MHLGADTSFEYVGSSLLSRNVPYENSTEELPRKQMHGTKVNTMTVSVCKNKLQDWKWDPAAVTSALEAFHFLRVFTKRPLEEFLVKCLCSFNSQAYSL